MKNPTVILAGKRNCNAIANFATCAGTGNSGRDFAQTLHAAKQQIRMDAKWSHPFYWSSLVLVGPN